jgi:hypothetical protein
MAKSVDSGADRLKIMTEEISRFNRLIDGHRKLLAAIGEL